MARKVDGSAEAWGDTALGGDASNVTLTNVVGISCGVFACVVRGLVVPVSAVAAVISDFLYVPPDPRKRWSVRVGSRDRFAVHTLERSLFVILVLRHLR